MSYSFAASATAGFISSTLITIPALPLSASWWEKITSTSAANHGGICLTSTLVTSYVYGFVRSTDLAVLAQASTAGVAFFSSAPILGANSWALCGAVFGSSISRIAYSASSSGVASTGSVGPTGMYRVNLGSFISDVGNFDFAGHKIGGVGLWSGVSFSASDYARLLTTDPLNYLSTALFSAPSLRTSAFDTISGVTYGVSVATLDTADDPPIYATTTILRAATYRRHGRMTAQKRNR